LCLCQGLWIRTQKVLCCPRAGTRWRTFRTQRYSKTGTLGWLGGGQNPNETSAEAALREIPEELYRDSDKQKEMRQQIDSWIENGEVIFEELFHTVYDSDKITGNVIAVSTMFGLYVPWTNAEMINKFRMPCRDKCCCEQLMNVGMTKETDGWILVPSVKFQPGLSRLRVDRKKHKFAMTVPFRHWSMSNNTFISSMNSFFERARNQFARC